MVGLGPRVGGAYVDVNLRMDRRSIDIVGGQIHRQLARLGQRNRAVFQSLGRDTVIAWRAALGAVVTGAPLMGSAISAVAGSATMLAGALYSTVQSSFGMLTVLGSVGIAAGTAKIGFEGFFDAIKASSPEELAETLERMSPAARDSALAVRSLGDEWTTLRLTVQENMFAGLSGEIRKLSTTLLPVLEDGLGRMAKSLNGLFKSILQYTNSESGLAQINSVLQGSVSIFDKLRGAAVPFLDGFLRLFNALVPAGERLAERITNIAERFQSWTQAEGFGNRIDNMMQRAEKTAGLLLTVLGNLGGAIRNVFNAGNAETNNFLQYLVDVTQRFKEWTASAEGKNSIVEWLQGAIDVVKAFGRAMGPVTKVLKELADPRVMVSFLDTVGGAFEHLNRLPLAGMVDAFVRVAQAIQPISSALLAIIIASASFNIIIGTLVGQLGGFFNMMARFSGVPGTITKAFQSFGYVGKHVGTAAKPLQTLLGLLGRFAKFTGPVGIAIWIGSLIAKSDDLKAKLGDVWDAFKGVFSALGGAFSEISTALAPVISGLSPVFDILDKIATLAIGVVLDQIAQAFRTLSSVISGIGSILAGFINVLVGLFTLDFGKVWDGLKQMGSGIGTIFQALWDQMLAVPGMFLQMGVDAFQALWSGIQSVAPVILAGIGEFIMGIVDFFISLPETLWDLAVNAFNNILDAIVEHGPGILESVGELVMGIIEFFVTLPLTLLELAMNAFASVLETIAEYGPQIISKAGEIITKVIDFFVKLPGRLLALATEAFLNVVNAVRTKGPEIISKAGEIVTDVIDFFVKLPGRLLALATEAFLNVVNAISNSTSDVRNAASSIFDTVIDTLKGLPGELLSLGKEMISQLTVGILGKLQDVKNAASRIVNAVKSFFPGSPVKEGPLKAWNYGNDASGAGRTLVDHIAKGLANTSPITKAMNDVSSAIAGASLPRRAVEVNASGALATATSTSTTARLDPRDIDLLADLISRSVERGAYRGVSEIGRGLALSGGRY